MSVDSAKWREWFKAEVKILGFEDAYKRLASYVKFDNYQDNTNWWKDDSVIIYRNESRDVGEDLIYACQIANKAIVRMMNSSAIAGEQKR